MKKQKPPPQGVQSLDTGLAVAFLVARAGRPLALTEIATVLQMLPSTAHRHLASLSRAGLIEQAGPSGLYDLGPSAIEFGLAALRRIDAQKLSSQAIERLRQKQTPGHVRNSGISGFEPHMQKLSGANGYWRGRQAASSVMERTPHEYS